MFQTLLSEQIQVETKNNYSFVDFLSSVSVCRHVHFTEKDNFNIQVGGWGGGKETLCVRVNGCGFMQRSYVLFTFALNFFLCAQYCNLSTNTERETRP